MFYLPRPDRLYQSLKFRRRPSDVSQTTAEEILAVYGLELLEKPQTPAGPGRSRSLILNTQRGKKLLKRYKHTVIVPTIRHEHSILLYLAQVDFPAPRLVSTPGGETLIQRGNHNYALFDFIAGGFQYHNYILLPFQVRKFMRISGETLATLHTQLADFVPQGYNPHGFKSRTESWWRDLNWYAERLQHCLVETRRLETNSNGNPAGWLLQRAGYLGESLQQLGETLQKAPLPRTIIHGDYGAYNLLFRRNAPVTVLDFEIARIDWRATELVDALQRFSYNRFGLNLDKMTYLIKSYQTHSPVHPDEVRLLPDVWTFLNVRRCILHWWHYCDTHDAQRLAQARWNLKLIDWMTENRSAFLDHLLTQVKTQ
jgi:Ser/Thr protein kinase RdoA (MazF antagonist)